MIDYHIHTSLCNHAKGRMEDYIEVAISKGLREICFMDHLTLHGEGSTNTMQKKEVPLYYHAIMVLKEKYAGRININAGLEVDFDEEFVNEIEEITGMFSFDAIGASVHFSEGLNLASRKNKDQVSRKRPEDILYPYMKKLDRMLDFDFFDIICHIDLPKKFTGKALSVLQNKDISDFFGQILKKIAEKGKAVEINTSGLYHPCSEVYPDFRILEECRKSGIALTLGSDAHSPEETGRDLDIALVMARKAGYSDICAFKDRKPYFINI